MTEKGHVWKESVNTAQGRGKVEVGALLLGNVTVDKVLGCF